MHRVAAALLATVAAGSLSHAHHLGPLRLTADRFDLMHGHSWQRRSRRVKGRSGVKRNGHRP